MNVGPGEVIFLDDTLLLRLGIIRAREISRPANERWHSRRDVIEGQLRPIAGATLRRIGRERNLGSFHRSLKFGLSVG